MKNFILTHKIIVGWILCIMASIDLIVAIVLLVQSIKEQLL